MIQSHTFQIKKQAANGVSLAEITKSFRGRYTQEEVAGFWPKEPAPPTLTPAEKGALTKAANKAKAEADAVAADLTPPVFE